MILQARFVLFTGVVLYYSITMVCNYYDHPQLRHLRRDLIKKFKRFREGNFDLKDEDRSCNDEYNTDFIKAMLAENPRYNVRNNRYH